MKYGLTFLFFLPGCFFHLSHAVTCKNGQRLGTGISEADKRIIVSAHNKLRNELAGGGIGVMPSASNMKKIEWSDDLASAAQRHSEECRMDHFHPETKFFGTNYGQNLHEDWSSGSGGKPNWTAAVYNWFNEYPRFPASYISPYQSGQKTGHFTQVAWADSALIGCGYTSFKDNRAKYQRYPYSGLYTCNYAQAGNMLGGTMYQVGEPCSDCNSCDSDYENLCAN